MKIIATLILAVCVISDSFAESKVAQETKPLTKAELIGEVIRLSNADITFAEATSRTLADLQKVYGKDDKMLEAAREYCRKNSIKPIYASALNQTFTEDELKILVEYNKSLPPEYKSVLNKLNVDFRMTYALEMIEWRQGLFDELTPVLNIDGDEQEFLDKALDTLESEKYDDALRMIDDRIKDKEWQLYFLYRLRAESYFGLKEFEKAKDDYIKSLPRASKGDVEFRLGKTYDELGEYKMAIEWFDKSIQLADDGSLQQVLSIHLKGRALCSLGKFSEARAEFLKVKQSEAAKGFIGDVEVMLDFCDQNEGRTNVVIKPSNISNQRLEPTPDGAAHP